MNRISNIAQRLAPAIRDLFQQEPDGRIRCCRVKGLGKRFLEEVQSVGIRQYAEALATRALAPGFRCDTSRLTAQSKPNGTHRFICAPSDRDRVLLRAIYELLAPLLDGILPAQTYGFRPGRSCLDAVASLRAALHAHPDHWLILADVKRCFPSLPVKRVLAAFAKHLGDRKLLGLLGAAFRTRPARKEVAKVRHRLEASGRAASGDLEQLRSMLDTERGVPEGNALSPPACNVYLASLVTELGHDARCQVVHYADNLAITVPAEAVDRRLARLRHLLDGLGLTVAKPDIIPPEKGGKGEFLGYEFLRTEAGPRLAPGRKALEL